MLRYFLRVVLEILLIVDVCFKFAVPYNWPENLVQTSVTNQKKVVSFSANQM